MMRKRQQSVPGCPQPPQRSHGSAPSRNNWSSRALLRRAQGASQGQGEVPRRFARAPACLRLRRFATLCRAIFRHRRPARSTTRRAAPPHCAGAPQAPCSTSRGPSPGARASSLRHSLARIRGTAQFLRFTIKLRAPRTVTLVARTTRLSSSSSDVPPVQQRTPYRRSLHYIRRVRILLLPVLMFCLCPARLRLPLMPGASPQIAVIFGMSILENLSGAAGLCPYCQGC